MKNLLVVVALALVSAQAEARPRVSWITGSSFLAHEHAQEGAVEAGLGVAFTLPHHLDLYLAGTLAIGGEFVPHHQPEYFPELALTAGLLRQVSHRWHIGGALVGFVEAQSWAGGGILIGPAVKVQTELAVSIVLEAGYLLYIAKAAPEAHGGESVREVAFYQGGGVILSVEIGE